MLCTPPGEFCQIGTLWFQVQQVCWSHVSCFLRSWPSLLSICCPNERPLGAATYTTVNETITATKHLNRYDFVISLFQHIKCVLIDVFFRFPKRSRSRKHHDSDSNPTFFVFLLFSLILRPAAPFLIYFFCSFCFLFLVLFFLFYSVM